MAAPTSALFKNAASFRFSIRISVAGFFHLIRLADGEPPSPQGEGCLRTAKVRSSCLKNARSINRPVRKAFCPCLPLEGKVSAEPTDEVYPLQNKKTSSRITTGACSFYRFISR